MIHLQVSRRTLHRATWLVLVTAVLAGLYGLGSLVSPHDGEGRPLVLSPRLRATERYRGRVTAWSDQMASIDQRLTTLLASEESADPAQLYAQSEEIQAIGEEIADLTHQVRPVTAPVAMVGLREQVQAAAAAYLETSLSTARWLSTPSETDRRQALEMLRQARALRIHMEESRWLATNSH